MPRSKTLAGRRAARARKKPAPARDAVFATYELLQQIVLELPPSDIPKAAKVNKIWNATIDSAATINKYLLSSHFALKQMHINSDRLQAGKITRLSLFWGEVYIKALRSEDNKEVVLAINKSDHGIFSIRFLNTTEGIPGLTSEDHQCLSQGLTSALSSFPSRTWRLSDDDDFYARVEFGLYMLADPVGGKTAMLADRKCKAVQQSKGGLRYRVSPEVRMVWKLRGCKEGKWENKDECMMKELLMYGALQQRAQGG